MVLPSLDFPKFPEILSFPETFPKIVKMSGNFLESTETVANRGGGVHVPPPLNTPPGYEVAIHF